MACSILIKTVILFAVINSSVYRQWTLKCRFSKLEASCEINGLQSPYINMHSRYQRQFLI